MNKYTSIEEAYEGEFGHLEHSDNHRAARVGDAEEMQRYVNVMRLGCCGYREVVVLIEESAMVGGETHTWTSPYLLGCNYGH
jgi:hypothetical protein